MNLFQGKFSMYGSFEFRNTAGFFITPEKENEKHKNLQFCSKALLCLPLLPLSEILRRNFQKISQTGLI